MPEQFTDSAADYAHFPFPLIGGDTYEERGVTEKPDTDEGRIYYAGPQKHLTTRDPLEVGAVPRFIPEDVLTHTAGVVGETLEA